ncbi:RNA-binding RNA annealing protein [Emydomyces testavorans]|uniref:RNA-binding RNA annealing protein n=1 Tax=Emydomyces testavorans TaxID=2070801 RepID=A0AAF0IHJ3_9EURO|nr:RNA-binding RNA annealing protein [Emydomyces testavorans]
MSKKLDTSLDEIINTTRASRRQRRRDTRSARAKAVPAPVGGVRKPSRQVKATSKAIPTAPSTGSGESKIIVSGLPSDVNEANIKEHRHSGIQAASNPAVE